MRARGGSCPSTAVWPGSSGAVAVWPGSSGTMAVWPSSSSAVAKRGWGLAVGPVPARLCGPSALESLHFKYHHTSPLAFFIPVALQSFPFFMYLMKMLNHSRITQCILNTDSN